MTSFIDLFNASMASESTKPSSSGFFSSVPKKESTTTGAPAVTTMGLNEFLSSKSTGPSTSTSSSSTATPSVVKDAKFTQSFSSPVDAAKKFMEQKNGKKNSNKLVAELTDRLKDISDEDLYEMVLSTKKYSLKEFKFQEVVEDSLKKSEDNLREKGLDDDQIATSAPRVTYVERSNKLHAILKKYLWDTKCPDNALSWANVIRSARVEKFMMEIKKLNFTVLPASPQMLYCNAYWMVGSWEECYLEMSFRTAVVLKFFALSHKLIYRNSNGAITASEGYLSNLSKTTLPNLNLRGDLKYETIIMLVNKLSIEQLFLLATVLDPRKLLQNKDVRITRNTDKEAHKRYLSLIYELMKLIILACAYLDVDVNIEDVRTVTTGLKPDEGFGKLYYSCYNMIRQALRNMKRTVLGGTGSGPNTRSVDLESHTDDDEGWGRVEAKWMKDLNLEKPDHKSK